MKRLSARMLLNYSTEQLWDILVGEFIIVFDDGTEFVTNSRQTLYSSYFWDFHRKFPETPLLPRHHVSYVLKGKSLTSKTHMELLGLVAWDVSDTYGYKTPLQRDHVVKMIYEVTNNLYNDLAARAEDFVVSIDILDFIEVVDHTTSKSVLEDMTSNDASISKAYTTLIELLSNDRSLDDNALARAVRAKMVNNNQVLQCIGPRGYLTDIDSVIFPTPVMRSYMSGMRSLHDSMVESRSAAKSLFFSEDQLQNAEYFARRLQLLAMTVENLHFGDCGSTEYLHWKIKGPLKEKGKTYYPGDLKFLVGKYYLNEETNQLQPISEKDTHLFGKTIKIRSLVAGCKHPDPHGVCSICFGQMADNVPPDANLGHICASTMTEQTSQSVLSTKHLDASSSVEPAILSEEGRTVLRVGEDGSTYFIQDSIKDKTPKLIVSTQEASGLNMVVIAENVTDLSLPRISEIDYIGIETSEKGAINTTSVCVSYNKRFAMFTYEFLEYIKVRRWTTDGKDNFVFDLTHWDFNKPVMVLPQKNYNMSDHSDMVAGIIESRIKDLTDRAKGSTPSSTLMELFDLVNSKLNVNLSLLEIVIYSAMVVSAEEEDYRLPKPWTEKGLGVTSLTIPSRSLSAAFAYEKQFTTITAPRSFFKLKRPDHPMDVFTNPELVEKRK